MVIFFGASSGKVLGNVTVKRPFSMVALICSSCAAIKNQSRFISMYLEVSRIPLHLVEVEECARTCHIGVHVRYNRFPHAPQTS